MFSDIPFATKVIVENIEVSCPIIFNHVRYDDVIFFSHNKMFFYSSSRMFWGGWVPNRLSSPLDAQGLLGQAFFPHNIEKNFTSKPGHLIVYTYLFSMGFG